MTQWFRTSQMLDTKPEKSTDNVGYNDSYLKQIKLGEKPTNILFIDCLYPSYSNTDIKVPYFEWPRHTFKDVRDGKAYLRSFLCVRGNQKGVECPSCKAQYDQEDKRYTGRRMRYFSVIALDWFYTTTNDYGDITYEQPESPAQKRQWESEGRAKVFGRRGFIEVGPGHASQLIGIASQISKSCGMCIEPGKKPGKLTPSKFSCAACKRVHVDMETTSLNGKEIEELFSRPYACQCGNKDLLEISFECDRCDDPRPAEIFDVVLPLAKRGKDKDTTIIVPPGEDIVFIDHYQVPSPDGSAAPLFDGQHFHPAIKELYEPLDFHDVFKVELNPAYHAKMTGVQQQVRTTIAPPPARRR